METKEMQQALRKMGYREMKVDVWGKPMGHTLSTYEFQKNLFTQWFKGENDKMLVWTSETIPPTADGKQNIQNIKDWERYFCKFNVGNPNAEFEFLTTQEWMDGSL